MATLNATTWAQAKTYVNNYFNTSDISGNGNLKLPIPKTADEFVPHASVLFQQIIAKHGGDGSAYHNHTGTAGGLIALIDKVRENGNPELAKELATTIYNNGAGVGYVMTKQGRMDFTGTSGCTRSDLRSFVAGTGVFNGLWAGRE
jgi:hypothetical protein